jgi:hypothetical protein
MSGVDLNTGECDGHAVVDLRGELDLADAAGVAAALAAVAAREPDIIVDLAALEFIDASGWPRHDGRSSHAGRFGRVPLPVHSLPCPAIRCRVADGRNLTHRPFATAAAQTPAGLTSPPP